MEMLINYEVVEYKYINEYEYKGHCKEMEENGWYNESYTVPQCDSLSKEVTARYNRDVTLNQI